MPPRHHILVLAAGRGVRMGGPKALLMIDGRSWWQHQQARLAPLALPVTWVVSSLVQQAMVASSVSLPEIVTADPALPMFGSVLVGLNSLKERSPEGIYILPVDCPAPSAQVWHALGASRQASFPTHNDKRGHPIYLPWSFVTGTLFPAASGGDPASPDLRLDHLVAPVARAVPVNDSAVATNLNTPEDVRAWLAGGGG